MKILILDDLKAKIYSKCNNRKRNLFSTHPIFIFISAYTENYFFLHLKEFPYCLDLSKIHLSKIRNGEDRPSGALSGLLTYQNILLETPRLSLLQIRLESRRSLCYRRSGNVEGHKDKSQNP